MAVRFELRRAVRAVAGPMAAALVIAYFALNAFQGDRGVLRLIQLRQAIGHAEATLRVAKARRAGLERQVAELRTDALDRDFLDERARLMTGLIGPNEIVLTDAVRPDRKADSLAIVGGPAALPR